MIKVIIADDEKKVCQLIHMLIDWKQFDMEVVAIVHNGIEVLEMIKVHHPDLIITDIRMPGLNGLEMIEAAKTNHKTLEFIIISGYRHFDYAQTAIKYGVNDYLLKPIKKEELENTLLKLVTKIKEKQDMLSNDEQLQKSIQNNVALKRSALFSELIFKSGREKEKLALPFINNEFLYHFHQGYYQVLYIKFDQIEAKDGIVTILEEKTTQMLLQEFQDICYDLGFYYYQSGIYCILNYSTENLKLIRKQLNTLLNDKILVDLIYQQVEVTMGLSEHIESIRSLFDAVKNAQYAVCQRLIHGTNRIHTYNQDERQRIEELKLFYEFNINFALQVQNLDQEGVLRELNHLKRSLLAIEGITGHEILQMTKEVCNVYLLTMRSNKIQLKHSDDFIENYNEKADGCSSAYRLFMLLNKTVLDSMEEVLEEKKQHITKPIRLAKQYIEAHYMTSLSLLEVSSYVGFNVTYFSSVFKKETGFTFLEYVSNIRMAKSKELLRETTKNITTICEEVGYSDVKHFTKSFKKHTGLKPNEFRKLYA